MWVIVDLLCSSSIPQVGDSVVVETWPTSRMDGFRAIETFAYGVGTGRCSAKPESVADVRC